LRSMSIPSRIFSLFLRSRLVVSVLSASLAGIDGPNASRVIPRLFFSSLILYLLPDDHPDIRGHASMISKPQKAAQ
ncbi:MAG: hypothetical protein ABW108_10625, partial [Candidatus Thiodiazotropha sp. 6PLUC10]